MSELSPLAAERIARDLEMVKTPSRWPRWPLLPLCNRHGRMEEDDFTALLFSDGSTTIYFGNLMMLSAADGQTWADVLGSMTSKTYASFDELVAEYRVD